MNDEIEVLIPIIQKVMSPTSIAAEIVGVQPMEGITLLINDTKEKELSTLDFKTFIVNNGFHICKYFDTFMGALEYYLEIP